MLKYYFLLICISVPLLLEAKHYEDLLNGARDLNNAVKPDGDLSTIVPSIEDAINKIGAHSTDVANAIANNNAMIPALQKIKDSVNSNKNITIDLKTSLTTAMNSLIDALTALQQIFTALKSDIDQTVQSGQQQCDRFTVATKGSGGVDYMLQNCPIQLLKEGVLDAQKIVPPIIPKMRIIGDAFQKVDF